MSHAEQQLNETRAIISDLEAHVREIEAKLRQVEADKLEMCAEAEAVASETLQHLARLEAERDQARETLRSVLSLCRDKYFPGTMDMRLDEIEQHVCKALGEG